MSDISHQPPNPKKLLIALFGKRVQLKNSIGKMILKSDTAFVAMSNSAVLEANNSFKIVNTPNIFEEEYPNPDQVIIDFMALTHPGPNLFILAIDQENIQEEKVVDQIKKLQDIFGEKVTANLVVTLPDIESYHTLSHLKNKFNTRLAVASENLASECQKWCSASQAFLYDFKYYNEDVVMRRMAAFEKRRHDVHQPPQHSREVAPTTPLTMPQPQSHVKETRHRTGPGTREVAPTTPLTMPQPQSHVKETRHRMGPGTKEGNETRSLSTSQRAPGRAAAPKHHVGNSASDTWDNIFNIILVGLSGTGKSASANTILNAGNLNLKPELLFKSVSSSLPVTKECECRIVGKEFGRPVRVVDTPDFLNDQIRNSQEQIEECKKYCQPGRCVVLLVMQAGRVRQGETGILEKLENKLGWNIRNSTIVLLTHGEFLKGDLMPFIHSNPRLQSIVTLCGYRYHLFKNTSKSRKQVTELIEKIPNYQSIFPKFAKNKSDCCIL